MLQNPIFISASASSQSASVQLLCRTSRTNGYSAKHLRSRPTYARFSGSFLNDQGNCNRTAPKQPASIKGPIPSLNNFTSDGVALRPCVKPLQSFAVNRNSGRCATLVSHARAALGRGGP